MSIRKSTQIRSLNGVTRFHLGQIPWLRVTLPVPVVISSYIYPLIMTVYVSFTKTKPMGCTGRFVGIDNFATVLSDPEFWRLLINSLIYAAYVVPSMVLLPSLLALFAKSHVPGIDFFRVLHYLPATSPLVVTSLAWRYLLDQRGSINNMLVSWGSDSIPFLSNQQVILFCIVIITPWQGLSYYTISYLSVLADVDKSLYEAAEFDSTGLIRYLLAVIVPGAKVTMSLIATLTTISRLKIPTEVYLLDGLASPTGILMIYIRD